MNSVRLLAADYGYEPTLTSSLPPRHAADMSQFDRSVPVSRYLGETYRHEEHPPPPSGYQSSPETRTAPMAHPDYRMRRPPMTPPQHDMYSRPPPARVDRGMYRIAPPGRPQPLPRPPSYADAYERRPPAPGYPAYREHEYYAEYARRPPPPPARYAPYPEQRPVPSHRPMSRPMEDDRRVTMARQPPMYEAAQRRTPPAPQSVYPPVARVAPVEQAPVPVPPMSNNDKKKRRIQLQCYIMYRPTRCLWGDCPAVLDCWSKLEKHIWHAHLAPSGGAAPAPSCKWEGCHYHADTVQEVYKHALVPHMKAFSARCPFNCLFEGSDFQALMDHIDRRHATSGPDDFVPGLIHHRPKLDAAKLPRLPPLGPEPERVTLLTTLATRSAGSISSHKARMVARKCFKDHHPRKEDFVKKAVAGAAIAACLNGRRQSKPREEIQAAMSEAITTTKRAKTVDGAFDRYSSDTDGTSTHDSDADAEGSIYDGRDYDLESEEGSPVTRAKLKPAPSPEANGGGKRSNNSPTADKTVVKQEIEEDELGDA